MADILTEGPSNELIEKLRKTIGITSFWTIS